MQSSKKKQRCATARRRSSRGSVRGGGGVLHPEVLLNCHLVIGGVRPAALVEPIEYGETAATDPKTAEILRLARVQFPDIEQTVTDFGIFLSLDGERVAASDLADPAVRGRLLGYPCAADTSDNVAIHVVSTFRSEPFAFISNTATDLSKLGEFQAIAAGANAVIQANEALRADFGKVTVTHQSLTSIPELINKIMAAEPLSADEMKQLKDILSDEFSGSSNHFVANFDAIVDVTNPVHIGIVLALLCDQNAKPWSPLYPIQHLPQYPEIKQKLEGLSTSLLSVLEYTRSPDEKPAIIRASTTERGTRRQARPPKKPWR